MGGQKRSFFVIIINIKQRRQAGQKSRHPGAGRDPSTEALAKVDCVADSECLSRAKRVPNSLRGRSSLSLGLGTALRRYDGGKKQKEGKYEQKTFITWRNRINYRN